MDNMYTFIDDISDIVDAGFVNMLPVKRDGGKRACEECGGDYCEEELLLCGGCTTCYHTFCLIPQLPSLPCGTWFCPHCVAKVIWICFSLIYIYMLYFLGMLSSTRSFWFRTSKKSVFSSDVW